MSATYRPILWLIPALVVAAVLLSWLDQKEEKDFEERIHGPMQTVILIGYSDEEYPGKGVEDYQVIGCDDVLVPTEIPVLSGRLASVLNSLSRYKPEGALHNPMEEKGLIVQRVTEHRGGGATVSLRGELALGGICDVPRLKAQVEETIRLFTDEFRIELNGSVEEWSEI